MTVQSDTLIQSLIKDSVHSFIKDFFSTPTPPKTDGAKILYAQDTTGTITDISLEINDLRSRCRLEPFDYDVDDLHLAKCKFYFSKFERGIGYVNVNFCCMNRNDTEELTSYGLKNEDLSKLLVLVINRLNVSISTEQGLARISSRFVSNDFSVIHDYIRNTCMTTLYSLIKPNRFPIGVDPNSYIPTQKEYDELGRVVQLYTELIGKLLTHVLLIGNPFGLMSLTNSTIKSVSSDKNFVWLELSK